MHHPTSYCVQAFIIIPQLGQNPVEIDKRLTKITTFRPINAKMSEQSSSALYTPIVRTCMHYCVLLAGSGDIVNSNLKLILGLIWTLILHYQISVGFNIGPDEDGHKKGGMSAKEALMNYIRVRYTYVHMYA